MGIKRVDNIRDAFVLVCNRPFNGRTPVLSFSQIKHHFDFNIQTVCAVTITFINAEYIPDFKDACLNGLNIVTQSGYEHNECCIRILDDIYF